MSRKSESREIDGLTFTVQQMPAMRGLKLMHKLARAAGPGLLKALGSGGKVADQDVGVLAGALDAALERFTADDLERLVTELFETATLTIDGKTALLMPVFNDQLAGKQGTVLKALKFALEVNYSDFLGGLLANVSALASPAASPSKAP